MYSENMITVPMIVSVLSSMIYCSADFTPGVQNVKPHQTFTLSCISNKTNVQDEKVVWYLLKKGDQLALEGGVHQENVTTYEGEQRTRSQIRCQFIANEERNVITGLSCFTKNGTSVETSFGQPFDLPKTMVIGCNFSSNDVGEFGFFNVGEPPLPPSDITCCTQARRILHCSWKPTHQKLSKHTDPEDGIKYTVELYSHHSHLSAFACKNISTTSCSMKERDFTFLDSEKETFYLLTRLNTTIIARNVFGSSYSTISDLHADAPVSSFTHLTLESSPESDDKLVDLRIKATIDEVTSELLTDLTRTEIELEYLFTNQSTNEVAQLIAQKQLLRTKTDDYSCIPQSEVSLESRRIRVTEGTWERDIDSFVSSFPKLFRKADVLANATVVVLARYRICFRYETSREDACQKSLWSDFIYSNVYKTRAVVPQKPTFSILWKSPSNAKNQPTPRDEFVLLYEKNRNIRYKYNHFDVEFNWTLTCIHSKICKEENSLNCSIDLQSGNGVGFSQPVHLNMRNEGNCQTENHRLKVVNQTMAEIEFAFGSAACDDRSTSNCHCDDLGNKNYTLIVFLWEVRPGLFSVDDLLEQSNQAGSFHIQTDVHEECDWNKNHTSWSKSGKFSGGFENEQEKPRVRYQSLSISRNPKGVYKSVLSFDFKPYTVYRFAMSLQKNNEIRPATIIENGYAFKTKAPTGSPRSIISYKLPASSSFNITWAPVDLLLQNGAITKYHVYVYDKESCGHHADMESSCSNTCSHFLQSSEVKVKNIIHDSIWSNKDILMSLNVERKSFCVVDGLNASTEYWVRVSAFSTAEGPCSDAKRLIWKVNETPTYVIIGTTLVILSCGVLLLVIKGKRLKRWAFPPVPRPVILDETTIEKYLRRHDTSTQVVKDFPFQNKFFDHLSPMMHMQISESEEIPTPYIPLRKRDINKNHNEKPLLNIEDNEAKAETETPDDDNISDMESYIDACREPAESEYTQTTEALFLSQNHVLKNINRRKEDHLE